MESTGIPPVLAWALALALLTLPGLGLLALVRPRLDLDPIEALALAAGLSTSLIATLFLLATELRLRLNPASLAAILILFTAFGLVWSVKRSTWSELSRYSGLLVAFVILFALTLATRLWAVRDLVVPAWVDSVHHALISQFIAAQGRLPDSFLPYLPTEATTYHFGFHAIAAALHWLSGLPVPQAILIAGQVLNALMVPATYLFARRLTGDRLAALIACLLVGLVTTMPAYYVSWGRYTQLAGLVILPALLSLLIYRSPELREALLAGLLLTGLLVTHYRVLAFVVSFIAAYAVIVGIFGRGSSEGSEFAPARAVMVRASVIGLAVTALSGAWLMPVAVDLWWRAFRTWGNPAASDSPLWYYITSYWDTFVLALAGLGAAWGLHQRRRFAAVLVLWIGLLFLLANPVRLGLPGGALVNNTSVLISLFLPLATLSGYSLAQVITALIRVAPPRWRPVVSLISAVALGSAGLVGTTWTANILNPSTVLFTAADQAAMDWIARSTPPDAVFAINTMLWQTSTYAGSDGGAWIPILAGRRTTVPPALYVLGPREYVLEINDLAHSIEAAAADADGLWRVLYEHGIGYVYIGPKGGPLRVSVLLDSPCYQPRYAQAGAWVFEVMQCQSQ